MWLHRGFYPNYAQYNDIKPLVDGKLHHSNLFSLFVRQRWRRSLNIGQLGRVIKSAMIVIDKLLAENQLATFCCALDKNIFRHFPLLGSLGKQF